MKKYYKAMATLTDGERKFEVTIYSMYKTEEEAQKGIENFSSKGYTILKTWIE